MAKHAIAAYGLYSDHLLLSDVVSSLNCAGFAKEDICMILSPTHSIAAVVRDASVLSEAASNGTVAGLIGWLSELGAVMIPTVGFFIRSQAFFHALMNPREAPALCGNARTLAGLGFSDDDADRFEHQLRETGVLVYISCAEAAQTTWAREVLRHTGAYETSTLGEKLRTVAATASA
jgi:hypothetical protein